MDLAKMLTDTLLGSSSVNTLSKSSGANKDQVKQVLAGALPTLVQSMQKNASSKSGEESLAKALSEHAKDDTSNVSAFLKNVDLEDGAKILGHILGDNKNKVESGVAKESGLTSSQTSTILASAAPLLLSVLGQQKEDEDKKDTGGLLSVLGSALLGGGDSNGSDGLGDALIDGLGSLLAGDDGKKKGGSGGVLGSLIGSLFGSGNKQSAKKTTAKKTTAKKTPAKKTSTAKKKSSTTKKITKKKTTANKKK